MSFAQARAEIDAIDRQIVTLLAQRAQIVAQVWDHKRAQGLTLIDPARESALRAQLAEHATACGLDPRRVLAVFGQIVGRDLRARQAAPRARTRVKPGGSGQPGAPPR